MLIQLNNITKVFGKKDARCVALSDISLQVEKGEFLAVMGASGSGKSTLLNIIGCLDSPTSGDYLYKGNKISKNSKSLAQFRNSELGFVVQDFALIEKCTVAQNISIPLAYSKKKPDKKAETDRVMELLGLTEKRNVLACNLSGGQRQRVAIARALVNHPSMILADEPTGALDSRNGTAVMEILKELNEQGITVILVTHDEHLSEYCKRKVILSDGKIINE